MPSSCVAPIAGQVVGGGGTNLETLRSHFEQELSSPLQAVKLFAEEFVEKCGGFFSALQAYQFNAHSNQDGDFFSKIRESFFGILQTVNLPKTSSEHKNVHNDLYNKFNDYFSQLKKIAYPFESNEIGSYPFLDLKGQPVVANIHPMYGYAADPVKKAVYNFLVKVLDQATTKDERRELYNHLECRPVSAEEAQAVNEPNLAGQLGVFVTRDVEEGEVLGVYSGVVVPNSLDFESDYLRSMGNYSDKIGYALDGSFGLLPRFNTLTQKNQKGNFIEASSDDSRFNTKLVRGFSVTLKSIVHGQKVDLAYEPHVLVAKRKLKKGEQVFDFYGWHKKEIR